MKYLITLVLVINTVYTFSQSFASHTIELVPLVKPIVTFDEAAYRSELIKRYEDKFKAKDRLGNFVEMQLEMAKYNTLSDIRYKNLEIETAYLKDVIKKTIPAAYTTKDIKVHIIKDPEINASCNEDGTIHIYMGLLAYIKNEAELAYTISHEYGHYYQKHSYLRFKKTENAKLVSNISSFGGLAGALVGLATVANAFTYVKEQEQESDFFAIRFFRENGYNPQAILDDQIAYLRLEESWKQLNTYRKPNRLFTTHPSTKNRLNYLSDSVRFLSQTNTRFFQVDSIQFQNLRKRAIDECIHLSFQANDFDECLRRAYAQHLQYPKDEFYTYYILETLYRYLVAFPKVKEEYFITENYKFGKRSGGAVDVKKSITYQLENVYGWNDTLITQFANKRLTNKNAIQFSTNQQAFDYFLKIAETACQNCYPVLKRSGKPYSLPVNKANLNEYEQQIYDWATVKDTSFDVKPIPVFIYRNFQTESGHDKLYKSIIEETDYEKTEYTSFLEKNAMNLSVNTFFPTKLNYREQLTLNSQFELLSFQIINKHFPISGAYAKNVYFSGSTSMLQVDVDPAKIVPELYSIVNKYGQGKIIFIDILRIHNPNTFMGMSISKLNALVHCMDFKTKKLYRKYIKIEDSYSSSSLEIFYTDLFKELEKFNAEILKSEK
jgi:hypothetical protein